MQTPRPERETDVTSPQHSIARRETRPEHREIADAWAGESCTINGHPAKVTGRLLRVATVVALDASGIQADYSWPTVAHRMNQSPRVFTTFVALRVSRP